MAAGPAWALPAAGEPRPAAGEVIHAGVPASGDGPVLLTNLGACDGCVRWVSSGDPVGTPAVPAPVVAPVPLAVPAGAMAVPPEAAAPTVRPVPAGLRGLLEATARRHGLPPSLLAAVAATESGFDPRARSPRGAVGLMQLMPATARRSAVTDRLDPAQSLRGGAAYLRWLLGRFDGDLPRVLAAYNAGEGAVDRAGGVPPWPETRAYVPQVLARRAHYAASDAA